MKHRAARDYENLLQCAIPAFESLLPELHNTTLLRVLYSFAQWHALTKLRLHNDFTLKLLEYSTTLLGAQVRSFDRDTCSKVVTRELPKEAEARARRSAKNGGSATTSRKPVSLGIYTIKFHYLGDYVTTIQRFGTTDSYSTETDFIPKLKQHLLPRVIQRMGFSRGASLDLEEWTSVKIQHERIYEHKVARFNFTTYDMRRDEDVIHTNSSQHNVMLLNASYTPGSQQSEHPYIYAKVLKIFHANASFVGVLPDGTRRDKLHCLDFLWVRWYAVRCHSVDLSLVQVKLRPLTDVDAMGFIDPTDVIHGTHLIPRFSCGKLDEVNSRWSTGGPDLWNTYFVNKFVDRDMFMRYQWGMAVGHRYMYPDFPPPAIPPISPDFDFCLLQPAATQQGHATHATTQPSAPEIGCSDSSPSNCTLPPSQSADDGIQDKYTESDPRQPDELNELDELDDRELVAYDDMYPIDYA
ncbi:hypothetical protein H1R20_g7651, partial [Candolleomyces eurysporus]